MPHRTDINSILIIGSGPIMIGQACEFDYSGTQALRVLKNLGYRMILVNSNPATIMTDPEFADATYLEPLRIEYLRMVIEKERPDALLPTMGGQTALNLARELYRAGVLEEFNVELIGAKYDSIDIAEDRGRFQKAMQQIGLDVPRGGIASSLEEADTVVELTGLPAIIRPAYTLGGIGGAVAYNTEEFKQMVQRGLDASPVTQVLIEESLLGWKEFELEVMRDKADNVVIVCSIENFDPLGVHTGDSITVAPAMTLTDKEYQMMRDASIDIMRVVGVDTGGSNIQFGLNPKNGRMVVIEMNPRVSRSSALASKATGYPIAKIAALLAVSMTLGEIPNDVTGRTVSAFEPTLDYVVVKIPRWAFEKFPAANRELGSQMKSIGEVMAIGRTFNEALQKALRSLETGRHGLGADGADVMTVDNVEAHLRPDWISIIWNRLHTPEPNRIFFIRYALAFDMPVDEISRITGIDPWFIEQMADIVGIEKSIRRIVKSGGHDSPGSPTDMELILKAKRNGFSDHQIAHLWKSSPSFIRRMRTQQDISPVYRTVDTCAAEFEAVTPYYYSTYGEENEADRLGDNTVIILGSGPNRIGQGIEFDYCCVQAAIALRSIGRKVIMVNCNPETVSTDYDIADRLYFEPVTAEDVIGICDNEKPLGVVLQFGGGTPLKLANELRNHGINILGTSADAIDATEDRGQFGALLKKHNITHPDYGVASSIEEANFVARNIGYPVLVRPSYVLGGRAMEIVYDEHAMQKYFLDASQASGGGDVLIDRFIEDAFEFDVDAVADGTDCLICGIMQHIEEAGIHSGDSDCVLPPYMLSKEMRAEIVRITRVLAADLNIIGLMNIQFAIKDETVYIIEVNPRASRTVPFVSKATGIPWAQIAAKVIVGEKLAGMNLPDDPSPDYVSVKGVKFPFTRFDKLSYFLGPEMRSTGEVMGIGLTFGEAFAKAQTAVEANLPDSGGVFISVNDHDKKRAVKIASELTKLGFNILATYGTHEALSEAGLECQHVFKVNEARPNVVDLIKNGEVQMVINTPLGRESHYDERAVGEAAYRLGIPNITTLSGSWAAVQAITQKRESKFGVRSLQEYLKGSK